MKKSDRYYGILKLSNKTVAALGPACYCICSDGDDYAQVRTFAKYLSSTAYR